MASPVSVLTALALSLPAADPQYDVVVYGGTASGLIAGIAAAREGKTVVVLEPSQHVGGMVTGGLGATDTGNRAAIGGYSREFFVRVREHYARTDVADSEAVKACSDGYRIEPSVASAVLNAMLREAKVEVRTGRQLESVGKKGATLTVLTTDNGEVYSAKVFIDASYEGDLLAAAGVKYTLGREGRAEYNESLAGVQQRSPAHQWPVKVPAYGPGMKLLPFIQNLPYEPAGTGDRKVQAYNFRLCMTKNPANRVPWPKPADYNADRYELLARYLKLRPDVKVGQLMNPVPVPHGKTDTNNNGPFSTDYIGANWDYPEANAATRQKMWDEHRDYTQGFLYFLANDPRSPEKLRAEMNQWGLAKDEFTATQNWPPQLYVREARRMLGVYVMTQTDIMEKHAKEDSVGLGSYNTDSHHVQRLVTADGFAINEGDFQVGVRPYAIPYRSLLPKPKQCDNLLVTVCVSASHVAYGTIRMEPVYMILGQAAGVAAALAVDGGQTVQQVPVAKLQEKLTAQKAVLSPEGLPGRGGAPGIDPARLGGIVVDDTQAKATGTWTSSASTSPYVGNGYLHDGDEDKGNKRLRYTPTLPKAGRYTVKFYYPSHANRAAAVPVIIHHAGGEETITVNQRKKDVNVAVLGTYTFAAGTEGWVEVRPDANAGHVVADAVQFVPAP